MGKDTVENAQRIELSWLKKKKYFPSGGGVIGGSLQWSRGGEPSGSISVTVDTFSNSPKISFSYKTLSHSDPNKEWKPMNYSFPLEKIPCRYGGFKWFVRCGLSRGGRHCRRRVRILYGVSGFYGCRHCADLTYEACNETRRYRGGIFGFLAKQWKADDLLPTIPRKHYRGKPTRKYRKYLKMTSSFDEESMDRANEELERLLATKPKK